MRLESLSQRLEQQLTGHYRFKEHESVLKYQVFMLMLLMLLSGLIIGAMSIIRLVHAEYLQAMADLVFVAILALSFALLYRDKARFKVLSRFVLVSALLTVLMLMHSQPGSFAPVIWISTTVYLMFFMLSKSEAWRWVGIVMAILLGIYAGGYGLQSFTHSEIFVVLGNILLLSLVLTWYERIKEESEQQHQQNEILLQQQIDRRTLELQQTNLKLEELNRTLERRVEEEIEANREKERIMLTQSRQAAMGDMISMIAHQWRQPITAIGMSAQNMRLDIDLGEVDMPRMRSKLQHIVDQTGYLSKTIDDFRDFLKPNKTATACNPAELIDAAVRIIGKSLENSNIMLTTSCDSTPPITTYGNEVIQVLLNILYNAKDILKINGQSDGRIDLRFYEKEGMGCFEVQDNAGGIAPGVMSRIFEPYFSTKEAKGGTGLGLYMSRKIIEKHLDGTIRAENSGGGARFTLCIPLSLPGGVQ